MKASKKPAARLARRIASYDATRGKMKDDRGYHKPGSMNRKKAMPKGTR